MVEEKDSQDLDLLGKKLDAAQKRHGEKEAGKAESSSMGIAMKIGVELAVSVVVVTYLGHLFDQWQNTAPAGLIVGVVLGFAAGIRNVIRVAGDMQDKSDTDV